MKKSYHPNRRRSTVEPPRKNFTMVQNAALDALAGATGAAAVVYMAICRAASPKAKIKIDAKELATIAGCRKKAFWRAIKQLKQRELITVEGPKGGRCEWNTYHITHVEYCVESDTPRVSFSAHRVCRERPETVSKTTLNCVENDTRNPINISFQDLNTNKGAAGAAESGEGGGTGNRAASKIPQGLDTPEFRAAFDEYQRHRRECRKPLTPIAAKKQLEKLETMGVTAAIEAIEHSIANGWQGIFPPTHQPGRRPTGRELERRDNAGFQRTRIPDLLERVKGIDLEREANANFKRTRIPNLLDDEPEQPAEAA
jgi:hypothetical protein